MPRGDKYWQVSFTSSDVLRQRERAAAAVVDEGERCVRDVHCAGRTVVTENSERRIVAARTYTGHCPACQGVIRSCLTELPAAYVRLECELGEPPRRGQGVHSPPGPRLPLRADVDWLQRAIAEVLASWAERVRTAAGLSVADTQLSRRRRAGVPVAENARLLAAHLNVLLALPAEPVFRSLPQPSHLAPDVVGMLVMDGTDAGEEIIDLHRRAERLLGETVRRREPLEGVPCKRCEAMSLERAEPPSDPSREAMFSCCADCRHEMNREQYDAWARWYAGWAARAGLSCRRCQLRRCAECTWESCACAADGHPAAPAA